MGEQPMSEALIDAMNRGSLDQEITGDPNKFVEHVPGADSVDVTGLSANELNQVAAEKLDTREDSGVYHPDLEDAFDEAA